MKKFIISLIFLSILCSTASAFEDTVDRYPTGAYTDYWTEIADDMYSNYGAGSISVISDPLIENNHILRLYGTSTAGMSHTETLLSVQNYSVDYISFIASQSSNIPTHADFKIAYRNPANTADIMAFVTIPIIAGHKYELIKTASTTISIYDNGTLLQTTSCTSWSDPIRLKIKLHTWHGSYTAYASVDDISDSSCIGISETTNEGLANFSFTWSSALMRSYTDSQKITLYSLSNTENMGKVQEWTIPENDNAITSEHGYVVTNRANLLDNYFGLYVLELTRGSDILTDQYFYFYQLSSPHGLPDILFLGESDVNTEIRDENNNGGELSTGGGSVYLFPDTQADGTYNFTYEILETPYAIKTELTTVYNNTALNSTTINYSGLSTQNYKVSIDGAETSSTNGADTYSYTFTDWSTETNHIISFAPDYTLAGVWGEVKNSETQEGIKSATVSVSGENFSKTLYTDDNGLFYLTKGLEAGKTYTISVSKTGYSTPPSQTAITVEGSTTRQDFYMDKLSTTGSGLYYAPHDVGFTVLEYWYSGAGLTGVTYAIYNGTESIKTGSTDSKGMFTGSDMSGGTNYTIILTHNGTTYTEYVEPSLTEYTFVLNKEGILHQYANSWLNLTYTENSQNVTIAYSSNKTITGASLTAIAGNGTTVYTQTLSTTTGSFTFETGGEGDYTLNFHIQTTDGETASQSWGLSYPDKIPLFPDSYPAWLKNVLFSGIVMVFLLAFGKSKNDIACGAVAIITSMGYMFEWFTGSFYFVVLVWIIALGAVFLHYKRTGGIG